MLAVQLPTDEEWKKPVSCYCGDAICTYFEMGYPFCVGCGEHHRLPVTPDPERICPEDLVIAASRRIYEADERERRGE